jgi:hypothetical protein
MPRDHRFWSLNYINDTMNANCYCRTLQKPYTKIKKEGQFKLTDKIILLHDLPILMWLRGFKTTWMQCDENCSNILHTAQTYCHTIFVFLERQRRPSKGHVFPPNDDVQKTLTQWSGSRHRNSVQTMCKRLWHSGQAADTETLCRRDAPTFASSRLLSKCPW